MVKKASKPRFSLEKERQKLLLAILPYAGLYGWNEKALTAGAKEIKMNAATARRLFPDMPNDLLSAYAAWADDAMTKKLSKAKLLKMKVRERIILAVMTRLQIIAPYKAAEKKAITSIFHKRQGWLATKLLYHTVDAMWRAAGDTSSDWNFYTKRLLLAGVYTSTLVVWLNDDSKDLGMTREFLSHRIEDVMKINKLKEGFKGLSAANDLIDMWKKRKAA
ncbi:MAG: COQ9 family protein [Dongiaceae bacterium]